VFLLTCRIATENSNLISSRIFGRIG